MMSYKVELYIYDLSAGLARQFSPMLGLGSSLQLDGIWHTAIVVHNIEWFYGAGGIEQCPPGGTMMGRPLRVQHLGETHLDLDLFRDYLFGLAQDQFRGEKYDLFHHNCNSFSNVVSQFLCGQTIPDYILELPRRVLDSPLLQFIRPLIEQATPHGFAMDRRQSGSSFPSPTIHPEEQLSFVVFSKDLSDQVFNKLVSLNEKQSAHKIKEENLQKVLFVLRQEANLDEKIWEDVFHYPISSWPLDDIFPFLDILRWASTIRQMPSSVVSEILEIVKARKFLDVKSPEPVIRMTLRLISNWFSHELSRKLLESHFERLINDIQNVVSELHGGHDFLHFATAALVQNIAVAIKLTPNQDVSFHLLTVMSTVLIEKIRNIDALLKILTALKSLISTDDETRDLARALDLKELLENLPKIDKKIDSMAKEIIVILN